MTTETDSGETGESGSNQSHALVEEAFALARKKLDQDEVTQEDIVDVYDSLNEAYTHPDSDIWVTLTALGPKNQCAQHHPENDDDPMLSPRKQLENIVEHEIEVTVE